MLPLKGCAFVNDSQITFVFFPRHLSLGCLSCTPSPCPPYTHNTLALLLQIPQPDTFNPRLRTCSLMLEEGGKRDERQCERETNCLLYVPWPGMLQLTEAPSQVMTTLLVPSDLDPCPDCISHSLRIDSPGLPGLSSSIVWGQFHYRCLLSFNF